MTGRSGPRSKTGCWMCRERKIKCDEGKPKCGRCVKAGRQCDYTVREPSRPAAAARSLSQPLLMPKATSSSSASSFLESSSNSQFHQGLADRTVPDQIPDFSNPWTLDYSASATYVGTESEAEVQSVYTSVSDPTTHHRPPPPPVPTASNTSIDPSYDSKVMTHFQENFVVSMQTKAPRWGFMNGLMHICRSDPVLMHFMLAVVGHEASSVDKRPDEQLHAIEHYRRGLADFNAKIGSGDFERHTLLVSIWLLTQYELRFADHGRDIQCHLQGFNQALLGYSYDLVPGLKPPDITSSDKGKESIMGNFHPTQSAFKLPPTLYSNVNNRLGLWMSYMDACASSFDLDGGVMHTLLHTFDANSIHRTFAGSREALKDIWGDEYPATEAIDDLQNRPAFDAYHHFHILRFKISEFRRSLRENLSQNMDRFARNRDALINDINDLTQRYSSLIQVAGTWPEKERKPDRLTLNLRFIIAFFLACVLEFYSLLSDERLPPLPASRSRRNSIPSSSMSYDLSSHQHPDPNAPFPTPYNPPSHQQFDPNAPLPPSSIALAPEGQAALTSILKICTIVHETEGKASLSRCNWPLFVAGVETRDVVHQNWCLERLDSLGGQGVNNERATRVLRAVVDWRRSGRREMGPGEVGAGERREWREWPGGEWREWVRGGGFEEFVI